MEAVPRLPMLHFPRKECTDGTSFAGLKQYIAECYGENPDSYSKEIFELESLRNRAVRPSEDLDGLNVMKRYICQIHSIGNRFPLADENPVLSFSWREIHSPTVWQNSNIKYEVAVMLFNVGGLHSQLGVAEPRTTPDSLKVACTHFQCAGWIYGFIRDSYPAAMRHEMSAELMVLLQNVAFAQAQECFLEKSLVDNRKAVIVAKITSQCVSYYNSAMAVMLSSVDGESISDVVGSKVFKSWKRYIKFKISYLSAILYLYQGIQSEEAKKFGERLTYFEAATEKIEEARKESKGMDNIEAVNEALIFTMDVIEAKRKTAKNENDFIYHEEVPELKNLSAVQAANLVNGISFSFTDMEVMGEDIFHRLVPMKAHESSSIYSEEKANLLRTLGAKIEDRDTELLSYMSSLNLDMSLNTAALQQDRLPQSLVDRCAALSAKPNAIPDLVSSMSSLSEMSVEVEAMLGEIRGHLQEEEKQEGLYQKSLGQRPPNGHLVELNREFQKYLEAHTKAGESNDTLRKAMGLHVANLKTLALPLAEIRRAVPKLGDNVDEGALRDLQVLLEKVEEMKEQRHHLLAGLREALNNDDITAQVIAWGEERKLDKLFQKELGKHDKTVQLIEQNMLAQGNILKALTEVYAKCASLIKVMNEVRTRREQFFTALVSSYDVYEDLLGKSTKGLEFYKKLHGNVQKLVSRVKAARAVQDEERADRLKPKPASNPTPALPPSTRSGPKLKDYLNSGFSAKDHGMIPSVRPSPLGSESVTVDPISKGMQPQVPQYDQFGNPVGYINPIYHYGDGSQQQLNQHFSNMSVGQSTQSYSRSAGSVLPGSAQGAFASVPPNQYSNMATYSAAKTPQSQGSYYYGAKSDGLQTPAGYSQPSGYSQQYSQAPGTGYAQAPTSGYAQAPTSGYSQAPTSGYSQAPASGYSQAPTSGYSQAPASGYSQAPASGYSQAPATGYSQAPASGYSQTPQGYAAKTSYSGAQEPQNAYPQNQNPYMAAQNAPQQAQVSYQQPTGNQQAPPDGQNYGQNYQAPYNNYTPPVQSFPQAAQYQNPPQNFQASYSGAQQVPFSAAPAAPSPAPAAQSPYSVTPSATPNPYPAAPSPYSAAPSSYSAPPPVSSATPSPYPTPTPVSSAAPSVSSAAPSITSHPTNPMYMGVQGLLKENPSASQFLSSNPPEAGTQRHPGYGYNPQTGTYDYGSGFQTENTYNYQRSSNQESDTPSTTDSSNLGVSGRSFANQYGAAQVATSQPGSQNAAMYYSHPYGGITNASTLEAPTNSTSMAYNNYNNNNQDFSSTYISANTGAKTGSTTSSSTLNSSVSSVSANPNAPQVQPPNIPQVQPPKSANFDLLSDVDFSGSSVPTLQPQMVPMKRPDDCKSQTSLSSANPELSPLKTDERKKSIDDLSVCSDVSSVDPNAEWESASVKHEEKSEHVEIVSKFKDAFDDPKILKWFHKEVERLEKFIETCTVKTLSGNTPLDGKWKELQDLLVKDEGKRSVSVAKLFPEKNRSTDSIPYDHARVSLGTSTDDYINAGYVKFDKDKNLDLGSDCPTFILAQTPLSNTTSDFWNMVWTQKANTVACLHPPTEILDTYWPQEIGSSCGFGDFEVTLIKQFDLSHCIERNVKVTMHGADKIHYVSLIQIKSWIKNSPNHAVAIGQNIITSYNQQNQDRRKQSPLVIHCLNGSERSGLVTVAIASILSSQTKKPVLINVVDVWYRICSQRKGALRDINTLQLSLQIVLSNGHSILNKRGIMTSYQMKNQMQQKTAIEKEETALNDPFKDIDPLWKLK